MTKQRSLNSKNINSIIKEYLSLLKDFKTEIRASNFLEFLRKIKRDKAKTGPYQDVSLFESANRIMTDLVILFGIKKLLDGEITGFEFKEYTVELGTENNNKHDIMAESKDVILYGEAFNVAKSFFPTKRYKSWKKLQISKKNEQDLAGKPIKIILIYNDDARESNYKPILDENNEYHLRVKLDFKYIENIMNDGTEKD